MRIIEKTRGYFRGTHKGATIEIEREPGVSSRKFNIRVTHADGGMMYDGYSPEGIETMAEAKKEAIRGACLDRKEPADA